MLKAHRLVVAVATIALLAGFTSPGVASAAPTAHASTGAPSTDAATSKPTASTTGDVPAPPADIVGSPASSTVARADDLLVNNYAADGGASRELEYSNANMSSLTEPRGGALTGDDVRTAQRTPVTASARPRNQFADRTLSFSLANAGSDGLWTLGTTDDPVQSSAGVGSPAAPTAGGTYQLSTKVGIVTQRLAEPGQSGDFGAPVTGTPVSGPSPYSVNSARLQWTVESAGDGYVQLVSRSDGLCLNDLGGATTAGAQVGLFYCQDQWSGERANEWKIVDNSGTFLLQSALSGLYLTDNISNYTQEQLATTTSGKQRQSLLFSPITEPGGVVPTWSAPTANDPSLPMAMATGDLDRAVDADGAYHDEAVVAYANQDHKLQIRVVDYNANANHMMVTGSAATLNTTVGGTVNGTWYPGSLGVAVGDFNGDGLNEIAVTYQKGDGTFVVALLSYSADGADRTLTVLNPSAATSASDPTAPPSLISGMSHTTSGDFEGGGRDDVAIAFGAGSDDAHLQPRVLAFSFTSADKQAAQRAFQPAAQGPSGAVLLAPPAGQTWTNHGVAIAAGLYDYDPAHGYLLHRRELALAWTVVDATINNVVQTSTHLTTVNVTGADLSMAAMNSQYVQVGRNANRDAGALTKLASQPLSLATGGFAGRGTGSDVPQWGIALAGTDFQTLNATESDAFLAIFRNAGNGGALSQTFTRWNDVSTVTWTLTAFDQQGRSVLLGAPVVMHLQALSQPTLIAQQPPAQEDWLNGGFVNVSSTPDYAVTMGSGKTSDITISHTTKASETFGVSEGFDSKTTVKEGLFGLESVGGSLDVKQNFNKDWDSENSNFTKYSSTSEYTEQATTTNDDIVNAYLTSYTVYRYPILGASVTNASGGTLTTPVCSTDCRPYFEVTIPGKSVGVHGAGRDFSWYQPTWQNNNALSYPQLVDNAAPTPDIGTYTYTDKDGKTQTSSAPFFNQSSNLDGNERSYDLKLSQSTGGGGETTTGGSMAKSGEVTAGINVKFDVGVAKVKNEEEVSVGVDDKSTWATTNTHDDVTTTTSSFGLEIPQINPAQGYQIATAYYKDNTGADRVSQGVDLTSSTQGKAWWKANYGLKPDLALNLPDAIVSVKNDLGTYDDPKWSSSPTRQLIRGFTAIQPTNPSSPQTSDAPYTSNPSAGDNVRFQVQVHNDSLKAAPSAPVDFYAVPVDSDGLSVTGEPKLIGSTTTPELGPQAVTTITSPAWTAAGPQNPANGLQNWRIFVVLDRDNTIDEIHPWKGQATCPEDSIDQASGSDGPLIDPMTGEKETLSCGQNNQGYGEITVMANQLEGSNSSAKVSLDGSGVVTGTGLHAVHGTATATVGQTVQAVVRADTTANSAAISHVLVFDGTQAHGNLIADTPLAGADTANGGTADFSWQPQTAGLHTLHEVLLRTDGTSTEQTLTIRVAAHGPVSTLRLTPTVAHAKPGQKITYTATGYDQYNNQVGTVTNSTTFTVAGGTCVKAMCAAHSVGKNVVTARRGSARGTATIQILSADTDLLSSSTTGDTSGSLPYTGTNAPLMAQIGAMLIAVGVAITMVGRRRDRKPA